MRPLLCWLILALLCASVALAQDQAPARPALPDVEARLQELEASTTLEEGVKRQIAELYRSAQEAKRLAQQNLERAEEFRRSAAAGPAELEKIRAELSAPAATLSPEVPEGATLAQLEQLSDQASANLGAARKQLDELRAEASKRQERRTAIPDAIASARQRVQERAAALEGLTENGVLTVEEARRVQALTQLAAANAEIESLEAELASYDARRELLPARRDRMQRRITELEGLVSKWQALVSARRQQEADVAAREAARQRLQAARQHPVLQDFAAETQRLAEMRTKDDSIPRLIDEVSEQSSEASARLAQLRQDYVPVKRRLEASGLTRATGLLLRRQYESLPDASTLERRVAQTQKELIEAEYTLIERQEQRDQAGDIDRVVGELLSQIEPSRLAANEADLTQAARELAVARREILGDLIEDSDTYFQELLELEEALQKLLGASRAYENYIGERIFWVRSVAGGALPSIDELRGTAVWLVNPAEWLRAGRESLLAASERIVTSASLALLLIALVIARRWARKKIAEIAKLVGSYRSDSFVHTLRALALTLIASAPWPALLWTLGWLLTIPTNQPPAALGVGAGLQAAAVLLVPLSVLAEILRPQGLATAHFRWQATTVRPLRRHLRWLIPIVVPVSVLVVAIDRQGDEAANASLGRVAFTTGLIALAVFAQRIFRPGGSLMSELIKRHQGGWIERLRWVWYPLIVGVPLALVVLTWMGYLYTSTQLESRLEESLALLLVLVIVNALLMRWLFLARRSVAVEEAKRRRQQAIADAQAKKKDGEKGPTEAATPAIDEDKLDLPAISAQTSQLFRTSIAVTLLVGLYLIWADVLPALRMFDRVELWPNPGYREVEQTATIPELEGTAVATAAQETPAQPTQNGQTAPTQNGFTPLPGMGQDAGREGGETTAEPPPDPVTLADVGLAIIILVATSIAFRNIPGLVDIFVLQRLPLDSGSRFALSTVVRYAIAIIGVLLAFSAIDISWSSVQWLAAALTFGLAFGLQEIFANFVSGLIILAERPIRIGDTVTIGPVSGTVTRIRMRATTVTDWDRKELVIPNKTFITDQVINWTLSDPTLRVSIPVGVGYGEDVQEAERVLLRVAKAHPQVLKEPKPYVYFTLFGDSTLNFELRVYIGHIDHLVQVRHELHMAITREFRAAKIEIAFPQRDLHIRSIGDLAKLVQKREDLTELSPAE